MEFMTVKKRPQSGDCQREDFKLYAMNVIFSALTAWVLISPDPRVYL